MLAAMGGAKAGPVHLAFLGASDSLPLSSVPTWPRWAPSRSSLYDGQNKKRTAGTWRLSNKRDDDQVNAFGNCKRGYSPYLPAAGLYSLLSGSMFLPVP